MGTSDMNDILLFCFHVLDLQLNKNSPISFKKTHKILHFTSIIKKLNLGLNF